MKKILGLIITAAIILNLCSITTFAESKIPLRNVALNKPVWCGNWYEVGSPEIGGPSYAVDGDTYSYFHGNGTTVDRGTINGNNYLTIDLGMRYDIVEITFNNGRQDKIEVRSNYDVQLSNYEDFSSFITVKSFGEVPTYKIVHTIPVEGTDKYRYVRFMKTNGNRRLDLNDICVYTADAFDIQPELTNVSQNKEAWSSGYYSLDGDVRNPSMAVDNNESTMYLNGTTDIHDKPNGCAYWAVDLGDFYEIWDIEFAADGRYEYTADVSSFKIELANKKDFSDAIEIAKYTGSINKRQTVPVSLGSKYRYVRVIKLTEEEGGNANYIHSLAISDFDVLGVLKHENLFTWYEDDTLTTEISNIDTSKYVSLCFDFENTKSVIDTNCDIFIATFANEKLEGIEILNNIAGANTNIKFVKTIYAEKGKTYRAYAWNKATLKAVGIPASKLK